MVYWKECGRTRMLSKSGCEPGIELEGEKTTNTSFRTVDVPVKIRAM
jgi:hypothetical protein